MCALTERVPKGLGKAEARVVASACVRPVGKTLQESNTLQALAIIFLYEFMSANQQFSRRWCMQTLFHRPQLLRPLFKWTMSIPMKKELPFSFSTYLGLYTFTYIPK